MQVEPRDTELCCHALCRREQFVGPIWVNEVARHIAGHRGERGSGRPETVDVVPGPIPDLYLETEIVDPPYPLGDPGSSMKIISAHTARVKSVITARI
jgi:hypothetical protein